MSVFHSFAESLFQVVQLRLGKLDLGNGRLRTIAKLMRTSTQTRSARVLFGDAHGVAVELLGQIAAEGQAVREAEETRPEVPDDGGAVGLFLGLCECARSDIETKEGRKGEL